jgi:ComF family protein
MADLGPAGERAHAALVSLLAPPLCWGCGGTARGGDPLCRRCRAGLRWLGPEPVRLGGLEAWAPLAYEGAARALVGALKFRGAEGVAEAMAAPMAASAPAGLLAGAALVPVPVHPARGRARGFNQAERLAASLARRTGLGIADCLARGGPPAPQVGRDRAARLHALEGAVEARQGPPVPAHALLVDDVITTGATLSACARALRGAGARRVRAVAYARTPGR